MRRGAGAPGELSPAVGAEPERDRELERELARIGRGDEAGGWGVDRAASASQDAAADDDRAGDSTSRDGARLSPVFPPLRGQLPWAVAAFAILALVGSLAWAGALRFVVDPYGIRAQVVAAAREVPSAVRILDLGARLPWDDVVRVHVIVGDEVGPQTDTSLIDGAVASLEAQGVDGRRFAICPYFADGAPAGPGGRYGVSSLHRHPPCPPYADLADPDWEGARG